MSLVETNWLEKNINNVKIIEMDIRIAAKAEAVIKNFTIFSIGRVIVCVSWLRRWFSFSII